MGTLRIFFFLFFFLLFSVEGFCQRSKPRDYTYSSTTDYYDAAKYEKQRQAVFVPLYCKDPTRVLLGNECVMGFTRSMGFEYVYPFTAPGAPKNDLHIFFSNTVRSIGLTFKNGFGWKRKVRRRIDQCRTSSGDFTG